MSRDQSPEPSSLSQRAKVEVGGNMLRVFVAIQLPNPVRCELGRVQLELQRILPARTASWVKSSNFHLTLRFLGDVNAGRIEALRSALRDRLRGFGALELICERLGCFPDLRSPRTVWAGVQDVEQRLAALHRRVEDVVAPFAGTPGEKHFVGHVTLARAKQIKRADAERLAAFVQSALNRSFGTWTCGELDLIRSELLPAGSRYTTLDVFAL